MTARFWDKSAARYAKSPIRDQAAYAHTLKRAASYLTPTDSALEIGCGTGTTALHLAPGVAGYTASDVSGNMIAIGRDKATAAGTTALDFAIADVHDPAFLPASYDAVLAFSLLHLMPDLPATLSRVHTLLKPGGMFISKTPCLADFGTLKVVAMRAMIPVMQALGKAPFVRFFGVEDLEAEIVGQGFDIVEADNHPDQSASRFIAARKA